MNKAKVKMCSTLETLVNGPEYPIVYRPKFRSVSILVLDGGTSYVLLRFCPFCGNELLPELSSDWFDMLEERGVERDDLSDDDPLNSSDWWLGGYAEYESALIPNSFVYPKGALCDDIDE